VRYAHFFVCVRTTQIHFSGAFLQEACRHDVTMQNIKLELAQLLYSNEVLGQQQSSLQKIILDMARVNRATQRGMYKKIDQLKSHVQELQAQIIDIATTRPQQVTRRNK